MIFLKSYDKQSKNSRIVQKVKSKRLIILFVQSVSPNFIFGSKEGLENVDIVFVKGVCYNISK